MQRRIVLLRGINLAGRRRVGMADLRQLLGDLGYADVRTHLQSGNVVLTSGEAAARLQKRLVRELTDGLGFDVEVIVRTRAELARVVARNPLASVANDPARLLVTFLPTKPSAAIVRELQAATWCRNESRSAAVRSTPGTPTGCSAHRCARSSLRPASAPPGRTATGAR